MRGRAPSSGLAGNGVMRDFCVALLIVAVIATGLYMIEFVEWWHDITRAHEAWEVDEALGLMIAFLVGSLWFAVRRVRELQRETRQRQHLTDELRQSEQRFKDITDIASDWIWETDADDRFTHLSERFTTVNGTNAAQLIGYRRGDLLRRFVAADFVEPHLETVRAREPFTDLVYGIELPDGRQRWFSVSGRPKFDGDGAFLGYRGSGRDVTAAKTAEAELIKARDAAQAADKAKSAFLTHMSHELRTPLHAILGFSDTIRRELFGPVGRGEYADYAEEIHASGRHLLSMVNDLLDLSKVKDGHWRLREEDVDMAALVDSLARMVSAIADQKGVNIRAARPTELPRLRADGRLLKQAVLNLLSNAIKYSDTGGTVLLTAAIEATGDCVLRVSDQGIGMAADQVPRLLQPFEQGESLLARSQDGTGLGLPLAKSFVEMMGGNLHINSKLGAGTTVEIRFPASRLLTSDAQAVTAREEKRA